MEWSPVKWVSGVLWTLDGSLRCDLVLSNQSTREVGAVLVNPLQKLVQLHFVHIPLVPLSTRLLSKDCLPDKFLFLLG